MFKWIPAMSNYVLQEKDYVSDENCQLSGKVLMFVDDERTFCELSKFVFEKRQDAIVVTGENGYEALKKLEFRDNYDMLVTDIKMVGVDGYELIESIRNVGADDVTIVARYFFQDSQIFESMYRGADYVITGYLCDIFDLVKKINFVYVHRKEIRLLKKWFYYRLGAEKASYFFAMLLNVNALIVDRWDLDKGEEVRREFKEFMKQFQPGSPVGFVFQRVYGFLEKVGGNDLIKCSKDIQEKVDRYIRSYSPIKPEDIVIPFQYRKSWGKKKDS